MATDLGLALDTVRNFAFSAALLVSSPLDSCGAAGDTAATPMRYVLPLWLGQKARVIDERCCRLRRKFQYISCAEPYQRTMVARL